MPDIPLVEKRQGKHRIVGFMTVAGEYAPGDPPPLGYNDWQEWAKVQHRAGLRQRRCGRCQKWRFPQEIARVEKVVEVTYPTKRDASRGTNARELTVHSPVCLECEENHGRKHQD